MHLLLACLGGVLVTHGLGALGLVDGLEFAVLAGELALCILEGLCLFLLLVGTLLELGLLGDGLVEAGVEDVDLALALLGVCLGGLEALGKVGEPSGLLIAGGGVGGGRVDLGRVAAQGRGGCGLLDRGAGGEGRRGRRAGSTCGRGGAGGRIGEAVRYRCL